MLVFEAVLSLVFGAKVYSICALYHNEICLGKNFAGRDESRGRRRIVGRAKKITPIGAAVAEPIGVTTVKT